MHIDETPQPAGTHGRGRGYLLGALELLPLGFDEGLVGRGAILRLLVLLLLLAVVVLKLVLLRTIVVLVGSLPLTRGVTLLHLPVGCRALEGRGLLR
jgi:hypothetical protein